MSLAVARFHKPHAVVRANDHAFASLCKGVTLIVPALSGNA
jgi:hypothetical protein